MTNDRNTQFEDWVLLICMLAVLVAVIILVLYGCLHAT